MTIEISKTIEKRGNEYVILSKKGKVLGTFKKREDAVKRLREIEFFKKKDKK